MTFSLSPRTLGRAAAGLLSVWICLPWIAQAQAQHAVRYAGDAARLRQTASPSAPATLRRPAAPHYDVVALRVEFQPDTTRFTTGAGTFDGPLYADGLLPALDPLPHDAAYFQAHLDFLADYVAQVSDGQTQVTTHLVPEVVRVSQPMGAYSPTGFEADSDAERAKLVALVEEAWRAASQASTFDPSGLDPERTAFVLFHAGVGRDIELLGTTLDKTPLDLPSITFDERALGSLASGPIDFKGVPVRNTLILPRTESRQAFDFIQDTPFLLELSTNGLLAASFFNFLGVPDLFNTETGESAIGPFGLMDPLGIFAFNGLFPPEPCAWTKYYLGWVDPQRLLGDGPLDATLSAGKAAPPRVARADVSSAEYFLIENRNRDPEGDGLVLRVWKDGAVTEQRVQNGAEGFNRFDVSGFMGGVVVGVDNYDWALPGGLDEDGNALNGGLLIWHVDERRLAAGLERGGVNADPERRAVDLEEADSAQDLGFPADSPFGPAADQGTPFDFFYKDNPVTVITATGQEVRLYRNRFGPDTFPDSRSNEGGPSFIVLEDFSDPGLEMSFVYRREAEAGVAPLAPFAAVELAGTLSTRASLSYSPPRPDRPSGAILVHGGETCVVCPFPTFWGVDGETGLIIPGESDGVLAKPARAPGGEAVSVVYDARIETPQDFVELRTVPDLKPTPAGFLLPRGKDGLEIAGPLLVLEGEGGATFHVGLRYESGERFLFSFREGVTEPFQAVPFDFEALAAPGPDEVALVGRDGVRRPDGEVLWTYTLPPEEALGQPAFGRDRGGLVGVVPVTGSGALLVLRADGAVERVEPGVYGRLPGEPDAALNAFPVLADLDDDGRLDVLTTYGSNLVAFSQNGALVRGFPIRLPAPSVAQPLVAELSDSGAWSVVVASTDGYVYAYDLGREGRRVPGFPLAVGSGVAATPLLQDNKLYAVSVEGSLRAWELQHLGRIWWGELYGGAQNQSFVELPADPEPQPAPQAAGLIVAAETYNWPNPIRDGRTFLRCMTREDARVRITIVDTAGSLVDEVDLDLRGGTPAEHLWQTDAASGVYFARVTATGSGGQTETRLIKLAIIR